jgi:hypothetical protein
MSTRPTVLHTKKRYGTKCMIISLSPNFFQIYTFLDSDFSPLIENHNNFQFSQAVCAKSSGKRTCLNHTSL